MAQGIDNLLAAQKRTFEPESFLAAPFWELFLPFQGLFHKVVSGENPFESFRFRDIDCHLLDYYPVEVSSACNELRYDRETEKCQLNHARNDR